MCLKPFKISFIIRIFHKLMRVGPCPVSFCAHTLTRENMTDATMAKFVLNKQARDYRLGHDFAMHAAAIEPTPQLWLRFLLGLHYWDEAGCCVNIYSASKYLLPEKTKLCVISDCLSNTASLWTTCHLPAAFCSTDKFEVWRSTSDRAVLFCSVLTSLQWELSGLSSRCLSVCVSVCQSACLVLGLGLC